MRCWRLLSLQQYKSCHYSWKKLYYFSQFCFDNIGWVLDVYKKNNHYPSVVQVHTVLPRADIHPWSTAAGIGTLFSQQLFKIWPLGLSWLKGKERWVIKLWISIVTYCRRWHTPYSCQEHMWSDQTPPYHWFDNISALLSLQLYKAFHYSWKRLNYFSQFCFANIAGEVLDVNIQALQSSCELRRQRKELHASLCNCMQAQGIACKLM